MLTSMLASMLLQCYRHLCRIGIARFCGFSGAFVCLGRLFRCAAFYRVAFFARLIFFIRLTLYLFFFLAFFFEVFLTSFELKISFCQSVTFFLRYRDEYHVIAGEARWAPFCAGYRIRSDRETVAGESLLLMRRQAKSKRELCD